MKKYFLAAIVAASPLVAGTSANAITVPEGSQLEITVGGLYATQGGGDISLGSIFDLSSISVLSINEAGPGIDLDGLATGSMVTASGAFTLTDGANSGLSFGFTTDGGGANFTINQSDGSTVSESGTGSSSQFGLGVLANGSTDVGSFSFGTTSNAANGFFLTTFSVPPEQEIITEFSPIPLPAAAWMLLAGIGALWGFRRYA